MYSAAAPASAASSSLAPLNLQDLLAAQPARLAMMPTRRPAPAPAPIPSYLQQTPMAAAPAPPTFQRSDADRHRDDCREVATDVAQPIALPVCAPFVRLASLPPTPPTHRTAAVAAPARRLNRLTLTNSRRTMQPSRRIHMRRRRIGLSWWSRSPSRRHDRRTCIRRRRHQQHSSSRSSTCNNDCRCSRCRPTSKRINRTSSSRRRRKGSLPRGSSTAAASQHRTHSCSRSPIRSHRPTRILTCRSTCRRSHLRLLLLLLRLCHTIRRGTTRRPLSSSRTSNCASNDESTHS